MVASHDMEKKRQGEGACMCVWKGANSIEKPRGCTVNSWCRFLHHLNAGKKNMQQNAQPRPAKWKFHLVERCRDGLPRKVEFVHV